jgi:hypothetical protein
MKVAFLASDAAKKISDSGVKKIQNFVEGQKWKRQYSGGSFSPVVIYQHTFYYI